MLQLELVNGAGWPIGIILGGSSAGRAVNGFINCKLNRTLKIVVFLPCYLNNL